MANQVLIKILDTGAKKYELDARQYIFGRRWENNATEIIVECPESENDNQLTAHITHGISAVAVGDIAIPENADGASKFTVTTALSQYGSINISFSFSGKKGYFKGSAISEGIFLNAQKPVGFIPQELETPFRQQIERINREVVEGDLKAQVDYLEETVNQIIDAVEAKGETTVDTPREAVSVILDFDIADPAIAPLVEQINGEEIGDSVVDALDYLNETKELINAELEQLAPTAVTPVFRGTVDILQAIIIEAERLDKIISGEAFE